MCVYNGHLDISKVSNFSRTSRSSRWSGRNFGPKNGVISQNNKDHPEGPLKKSDFEALKEELSI